MTRLFARPIFACALLAVLSLTTTLIAQESAAPGTCTRLSAPPNYPLPVLATVEGYGPYCLPLGAEGEEQCLVVRLDEGDHWQLERLAVTRPDEVQIEPVTTLEGRLAEDKLESLIAGDANGDGAIDLLFEWANRDRGDQLEIYLACGGGIFERGETLPAEEQGRFYSPVFGDFDGDGAEELAVAQSSNNNFLPVYKYRQDDGFTSWRRIFTSYPKSLSTMDVNGDGIDDLVYLSYLWPLSIVVNFGDRESPLWFSDRHLAPSNYTDAVYPLVDGREGAAEIMVLGAYFPPMQEPRQVAHAYTWDSHAWVPSWSQVMPERLSRWPTRLDVDGDGRPDFVFENGHYYSYSTGGFQVMLARPGAPLDVGPHSSGAPTLFAVQDLDGDGRRDALVKAPNGALSRYPGQPGGGFDEKRLIWKSPRPYSSMWTHKSGDLDLDGRDDLVVAVGNGVPLEWWKSLGDGHFEPQLLPELAGASRNFDLVDLNADGLLDITRIAVAPELWTPVLFVARGEGGGHFGPWRAALSGYWLIEHSYLDLDGDGDLDLVSREDRQNEWRNGSDLSAFLLEEGSFHLADSHYIPPFQSGKREISLATGDIDRDGLKDIIHYAQDPDERYGGIPVWRRNLGDGHLADPVRIFHQSIPGFPHFVATDVDRDGDADLIVLGRCYREGRPIKILGNDNGRLRMFWEGPVSNDCPSVQLYDLDADGLPDLVEASSGPVFRVWTASGAGSFGETLGPFFVGNFTPNGGDSAAILGGGGLDHFRTEYFDGPALGVLTLPQTTPVLDEDIAPPQVDLLLSPEVDIFAPIEHFENNWRISGQVSDECGIATITRLLAQTPPIDPAAPHHFKPTPGYEIRLYEASDGNGQELVLTGPDEAIARDLYAQMLSLGGMEIELNAFLEIRTHEEWGPPPRALDDNEVLLPDAHLSYLWRFDEGRLHSVFVRRPGADLSFEIQATDSSGKRSTAHGSYQEQRQAYCQTHEEPEILCH